MDEKKGYTKEQVAAFIDLMDEIEGGTLLHPRYDKYWFCWNNLYNHLLNIVTSDDVKVPEVSEEEPEEEEDVENSLTEEQIKEYLESLRKNKKEEKKEPIGQVKEVVKPKIKKEEVSLLDD